MTTAQIAQDAAFYVRTQPIPRRGWPVSVDAVIARFDVIERDGQYDRADDGLRRSREGEIGEARMMCQVAVLGSDTLLIFWNLGTGKQRRVLIDATGAAWMDADGRAVKIAANNKYSAPCLAILQARAN